jgi:hypothetical protein
LLHPLIGACAAQHRHLGAQYWDFYYLWLLFHILFDQFSEGVLVVEMSLTVFVLLAMAVLILESVTIFVLEPVWSLLLTNNFTNCGSILWAACFWRDHISLRLHGVLPWHVSWR